MTPEKSNSTPPNTGCDTSAAAVKILLVEDHKDTRLGIQRLLQMAGHQVTAAASAQEALDGAARQNFDLVISDLGLPDQPGHDLMRQLSVQHGLTGIALSGYSREEDIELSHQAGFSSHLTKPVSFEQLKHTIIQVLNLKK